MLIQISHFRTSRKNGYKLWVQRFLGSFGWTSGDILRHGGSGGGGGGSGKTNKTKKVALALPRPCRNYFINKQKADLFTD